jgi:hypothetical protein
MRHAPLYIILLCLLSTAVPAQEEGRQTFVKIIHSASETIAIDSSGDEWIYDRDQGKFVPIDDYEAATGETPESAGSESGPSEIVLPPEIRCTDVHEGDIVELFRDVTVGFDERVEGMVLSGRDVVVKGLVIGDVVSFRTVTVESSAEIRGDVVASEIIRERGGRILGEQRQMPMPGAVGVTMPRITPVFPNVSGVFLVIFQIFVVVIVLALASGPVGRIIDKIEHSVVKSFFWGLLTWFAILPIFVLLIITIVGIPVALLVYPFALLLAIVLAFVSSATYIGRLLSPLFGWEDRSRYLKAVLGVVAVGALLILSNLADAIGVEPLRGLLAAVFVLIGMVALTVGLGGVVTARFGMRPKAARPGPQYPQAPMVSPPPPPGMDTRPKPPPPPAPPPKPGSSDATKPGDQPSNNQ